MAKNPPEERLVYLALKNVFKGPDAQLRIAKKIRKLIQKQLDDGDAEVHALVAEHNIDNVYNTAKALLQDEIFASTLKAKIRFPEVFEVSPAQSAERVASEAEAARSDADTISDAAEGHQETSQRQRERTRIPSLDYSTSKAFLSTCERLCSVFISSVPTSRFSTSTSGEGTSHTARVFLCSEDKFDADKLVELGKPFPELLDSIAQLRHTAVHRVRVSANKVQQFVTEAESLANVLRNDICAQILSRLQRVVQ
ncbi:hypothetical protein DL95DRAFT_418454 [Leptodontidium sp. 2 PMI_412]|nr:hypothetical protein DL95DRAFT_418454 [Leptodontidium sp. 2 PMI_412]